MRLTRWSHACVVLESNGRRLVIDPGEWSEAVALDGAHAVLVTHHHGDHADRDRLQAAGLPVWAPRGSELGDTPYSPVDPGQTLTIEGFEVTAVGGRHAAIVPGQEVCANLGYVVTADGESVYHPGDALAVPDVPITTLLVPMQGNWLKTVEAIELVRAIRPDRAVGIHDAMVNDRARAGMNHWLASEGGTDYHWLAPGTTFGEDGGGLPRVRQLRLVVAAEDFEAAVAFYRDALGLPVELDLAGAGGERVLILDAGRATLELSNPAQVAMIDDVEVGRRVAPRLRVAFEVDDAAATTDMLVAAGADLVARPTRTPWESLNARLEAPAGLQITVFQEQAPSPT
jgi:L-ascorbate metabolism protein UlaG (beta-lactamase superfamily)/predicted enzyme related to lactoylglutathione lyase